MRWCPSLLALSLSHFGLYLPQYLALPRLPLDVFNPRKWDEHAQLYQALVNLALRD